MVGGRKKTNLNELSNDSEKEKRKSRRNNNHIIITDICKAPTLRLKTLNKHTHIMYIEMENVIKKMFLTNNAVVS